MQIIHEYIQEALETVDEEEFHDIMNTVMEDKRLNFYQTGHLINVILELWQEVRTEKGEEI